MAQNLFTDFPDRVAVIKKSADLGKLAEALEETFGEKGTFQSPEEAMQFYLGALEEMGKYAAQEMKPQAAAIDAEGAHLKDGEVHLPDKMMVHMKRCAELGVFNGPVSRKYGGMNLPRSVQMIAMEMFGHACPNTGLNIACFSMADFVQMWGSEDQKQRYLGPLMNNEILSSMALTEPGAGSDLGKLRTSAVKQGDKWIVNGAKIFITNGFGDITFALVRTDPKSEGLKGLSVLIVPRRIDGKENFKVTKIEEKVCLHASATCEILFENSVGELMGPEGDGFKVMSDLMNGARLAMGVLSVGIAQAALEAAQEYAATRVTMGKPIAKHPMIAEMMYEAELEIRAMRQMNVEAAIAYDWMNIYRARGDEKNFKHWKKRYRRLTPLVKYMGSERAIVIARNAVQIFGGYGVCKEYPVERFWRETIIYPIYEGTSQIQSLMVLKDTLRDVATQATGFLGSLAGAWAESLVTANPVKRKLLEARNELNQGIKTILGSIFRGKFRQEIDSLKQQKMQDFLKEFSLQLMGPKTDLSFPFLCAERFTRVTCDYYALKCLADRLEPGDTEREQLVLQFAALVIPRMRLENHYMENRSPETLEILREKGLV